MAKGLLAKRTEGYGTWAVKLTAPAFSCNGQCVARGPEQIWI